MAQTLPGPHEGVVVGVYGGDLTEDVMVWAAGLLPLHRLGAVVPGVVDHHSPVMETDAQHERVVHDPLDDRPHLLLSPLD